jgi:hypothetical protein
LELAYLNGVAGDELKAGVVSVLQNDPGLHSLDDAQKVAFFRLWARSDSDGFMQRLSNTPSWQRLAWRQVAALRVSHADMRGGCELAFQFTPKPALPQILRPRDEGELRRRFLKHPDDFLAGYALCEILSKKDEAAALQVARGLTALPECPNYFYFLEAALAYRTKDFPGAWRALQKYAPISNE